MECVVVLLKFNLGLSVIRARFFLVLFFEVKKFLFRFEILRYVFASKRF